MKAILEICSKSLKEAIAASGMSQRQVRDAAGMYESQFRPLLSGKTGESVAIFW